MAPFTNDEYADILECCGYCDSDDAAVRREYLIRFPDAREPDNRVFNGVYLRVRNTGKVQKRTRDAEGPCLYAVDAEDEILLHFEDDPTTYLAADRLGMLQWKV